MRTRNYESPVATLPASASAREIAARLAERSVGSIVVVDEAERPLGIVTDRDLLVRVVAEGRDPDAVSAAELMTKPLVQADPQEPIERLIERMAAAGVRRIPIVEDGRLVGIVALDDLLVWLVRELDDLAQATRSEIEGGWKRARRARRPSLEERLGAVRLSLQSAGEGAASLAARELDNFRERMSRLIGRSEGAERERDAGDERAGPGGEAN